MAPETRLAHDVPTVAGEDTVVVAADPPIRRSVFLAGSAVMVTLGFLLGVKSNFLNRAKPALEAAASSAKRRPELLYDSPVLSVGHLEEANTKPDYKLATKALAFGSAVALSFFGAGAALTCYALDIRSLAGFRTALESILKPRLQPVKDHLGTSSPEQPDQQMATEAA